MSDLSKAALVRRMENKSNQPKPPKVAGFFNSQAMRDLDRAESALQAAELELRQRLEEVERTWTPGQAMVGVRRLLDILDERGGTVGRDTQLWLGSLTRVLETSQSTYSSLPDWPDLGGLIGHMSRHESLTRLNLEADHPAVAQCRQDIRLEISFVTPA